MKNISVIGLNLLLILLALCSCKKLVEVDSPETSISSKTAFNNDATAIGAITSLYTNLSNGSLTDPGELIGLSSIASLSADDLDYYPLAGNPSLGLYYQNAMTTSNPYGTGFWGRSYERIYLVNMALEEIPPAKDLNPKVKQQLLGEASFMRAFYYFYLVNLYGDVPLVLTTDYNTNALINKSPKGNVYTQIISDLKEAENLLSDKYLKADGLTSYPDGNEERIRPTKWAATALMARTYLFTGQWTDAERAATSILSNTAQYQLTDLNQVFLKNNMEAIWQLQPVSFGYNTADARVFIIPDIGPGPDNPVFLSDNLWNFFEPGDHRKTSWLGSVISNGITYHYPFKYKVTYDPAGQGAPVTEYNTVMRLAEQYLIRAEARVHLGNRLGAISDLDKIRERAGLKLIKDINPNIGEQELIAAILKEKRAELFTEWGHRWLDLKRTGKIDEVMTIITPTKGGGLTWKSYQQYYPISINELKFNPNLTPTPGY